MAETIPIEKRLVENHGIAAKSLEQARTLSRTNRLGLLENLHKMELLTDRQAIEIEAEHFRTRVVALKNYPMNVDLVNLIPEPLRAKYQVIPLGRNGNLLSVATPSFVRGNAALAELNKATGCVIHYVLAYPAEIAQRLNEFSQNVTHIDEMLEGKTKQLGMTGGELDKKLIEDPHGPIAKVINHLLTNAINTGVSDIHFEPLSHAYRVRYREDGMLREIKAFDRVLGIPMTASIKVMAGMDIAETRFPQDGAIKTVVGGRKVDLRVATFPAEFGEKTVVRVLDSNKDWVSLDALALCESEKVKLVELLRSPQGLILLAGPTGSGKTTSIYALLGHVNSDKKNILTIEDPIEYRLQGVTQAQVNVRKGFTFATGLRAMLRLDPNIIFIGEIRDTETAETGVQAAMTGHLVLSTIHANSATQTVARLTNMGVDRYTLGSALRGVLSQRLVRRICERCREPYQPTDEELRNDWIGDDPPKELFRGRGCHHCHQSGYKGRTPVIEMLVVNGDVRSVLAGNEDAGAIFKAAIKSGIMTIQQDGMAKARAGITTLQELWGTLEKPGNFAGSSQRPRK